MSLDHYGFVRKGVYSPIDIEKEFLDKEERVTDFILGDFKRQGKLKNLRDIFSNSGFKQAFYDSIIMKLTNKNYGVCSNLSKRLVMPQDNFNV
jgi:hypothetical protein